MILISIIQHHYIASTCVVILVFCLLSLSFASLSFYLFYLRYFILYQCIFCSPFPYISGFSLPYWTFVSLSSCIFPLQVVIFYSVLVVRYMLRLIFNLYGDSGLFLVFFQIIEKYVVVFLIKMQWRNYNSDLIELWDPSDSNLEVTRDSHLPRHRPPPPASHHHNKDSQTCFCQTTTDVTSDWRIG